MYSKQSPFQQYNRLHRYGRIPLWEDEKNEDDESDFWRPNMSVAIVLKGSDGIVLATDSRLTEMISNSKCHYDNSQKLWQLCGGIGLTSVGMNSRYAHFLIHQYIDNNMYEQIKGGVNFKNVLEDFGRYIREDYWKYSRDLTLSNRMNDYYRMQITLSGYDGENARIVCLDSSTQQLPFAPEEYDTKPCTAPLEIKPLLRE